MKHILRLLMIAFTFLFAVANLHAEQQKEIKEGDYWWNQPYPRKPAENPDAKKLPLISVKENEFVNPQGKQIMFRGLAISDPDKLEHQGYWNKKHFEEIKKMGANIVRIPVHPIAWRERTPEVYLKLLDDAVKWCTELKLYIIIDWHSIGNLEMEIFQSPMYNTTKKETYEFWRTITFHFKGNNTVAFYEIFNEPTHAFGLLGSMTWSEWKKINEDIINLIRAYDQETIPIVSGFDWAYDLSLIHYDPINVEGIAYATHPYFMKRKKPWEPKWDENFGFVKGKYPVIATEFGFDLERIEKGENEGYGEAIINYLEERNISWIAWIFDADWHPKMLKAWENYELTGSGEFFKKALHRKIGK
ncbi:cellulase family glycosylhydrolase [candidate division WOR-3 bacterium]|nr:cellulase family glycosylhydrolase [candidate division WOR-3 bacterium]